MPSVYQGLQGAVGGAETGMSLFPAGGYLSAGLGAAAGFGLSLFDQSPEDARKERYRKLLEALDQEEKQAQLTGAQTIEGATTRKMATAGQGGARLARSLGRADQTVALQLPEQSNIAESGANALSQFSTGVQREYGARRAQAATEFADRPIEPGVSDLIGLVGNAAMKFRQNKDFIGTLGKNLPAQTPSASPTAQVSVDGGPSLNAPVMNPMINTDMNNFMQPSGGPGGLQQFGKKKKSIWQTGFGEQDSSLKDVAPFDSSGLLSGVYN